MSGFVSPNHTQVPNDLFDHMLPLMREAELKVVLHAIRQTLGFHRGSDAISISQFMKGTGLSRQGVVNGLEKALERGVMQIAGTGKRGVIVYRLVNELDQSTELTGSSQESRPEKRPTSQQSRHTKEKEIKETPKQKESEGATHTPIPYHITNGLGRSTKKDGNVLVAAIRAHEVWKAFVRGWDGIDPPLDNPLADTAWDAVVTLQGDLDDHKCTLADIEETTRWRRSDPKTRDYRISFVKTDMQNWRAWTRSNEARPSTVKGAGLKPAPAPLKEDINDSPVIRKINGIGEHHADPNQPDTREQRAGKGLLGFDTPATAVKPASGK